jgi:prolipoprotein diacylglyceryltransferase
VAIFGLYAVISGLARFLVEEIRINPEVLLGMTQPQVWSLTLVVIGVGLLVSNRLRGPADDATCDAGRADTRPLQGPPEIAEPFRSVPVTRES